jgi:hypothetical protein
MSLRRALFIAVCALPLGAVAAHAQFQQPQQEPPPCIKEFLKLRAVYDTRGKAIQAASQQKVKPGPQEACKLFNSLLAAEAKMLKYAEANTGTWGCIPADIVQQIKTAHAQTSETRAKICRVAAAPAAPRGPSLSDALTAPVPSESNIKTGRGTFDTLTGSPLGSK